MKLVNQKRSNSFRSALDTFSQDNFSASFRSITSITSSFYRWLATTRFKVRNNTETNKHKAFIDFYSDREMMLNRYGNVFEANANRFFNMNLRPMLALHSYELSTSQYRVLGQEYAEFDIIKYVDASGGLVLELDHQQQIFNIFHDAGDAPAFVTAGYLVNNVKTGKVYYVVENEPVSVEILFNSFIITLNDDEKDIRGNKEFLDAVSVADVYNGFEAWYEILIQGSGICEIAAITHDYYGMLKSTTLSPGVFELEAIFSKGDPPGQIYQRKSFSGLGIGDTIYIDNGGSFDSYTVDNIDDDDHIDVLGTSLSDGVHEYHA